MRTWKSWALALTLCLLMSPASAQRMMVLGTGGPFSASAPPAYTGPGDIVASATAWHGLRGYSAAYAAPGTGKSVNVRRASDNATQDIVILTTGALDVASYNTFVGTDATASCTISGTAVSCSGASATIHVNDPVAGVGITNPCTVTVTNGSTTATASLAGTSTTCGTVGVAETVTFQVAGFTPKTYDQSGANACTAAPCDATQGTAGSQLQVLPLCLNSGTLPCLFGSGSTFLASPIGTVAQPLTVSAVVERTSGTVQADIFSGGNGAVFNTANVIAQFYGSFPTAAATDVILHAFQLMGNAGSSGINVDGVLTSASAGAGSFPNGTAGIMAQGNGTHATTGYLGETGIWGSAFNSTVQGNMRTNQKNYWGTP